MFLNSAYGVIKWIKRITKEKEKVKKEMNKKEPKILLIIPAYNEEENMY